MESKPPRDNHALGETSVPLTLDWINQQIRQIEDEAKRDKAEDGQVPPPYGNITGADPDKAKTVVAPTDNTKVEVEPGKDLYLGVTIQDVELKLYHDLLKEYSDVFAWSAKDLTGILPKYGVFKYIPHQIGRRCEPQPSKAVPTKP
jgi:hypothetical protein